MEDRDEIAASFLTLVDDTFRRLLEEPDAHLHMTGFADGDVAFVMTRDGLEVRRRAEVARLGEQQMTSDPGASW